MLSVYLEDLASLVKLKARRAVKHTVHNAIAKIDKNNRLHRVIREENLVGTSSIETRHRSNIKTKSTCSKNEVTNLDVNILSSSAGNILRVSNEVVEAAAVATTKELKILHEIMVSTDESSDRGRLDVGDVAREKEREETLLCLGRTNELDAHRVAVEGVGGELDVVVELLEDGIGDILRKELAESTAVGSSEEALHSIAGDRTGDSHIERKLLACKIGARQLQGWGKKREEKKRLLRKKVK